MVGMHAKRKPWRGRNTRIGQAGGGAGHLRTRRDRPAAAARAGNTGFKMPGGSDDRVIFIFIEFYSRHSAINPPSRAGASFCLPAVDSSTPRGLGAARRFAAAIGRHAKERSMYLKHELEHITARKAEIEAHLHSTTVLQERLARFQPEIGGCLQCPRCWVDREMRSSLTRAPSTEKEDNFGSSWNRVGDCGA